MWKISKMNPLNESGDKPKTKTNSYKPIILLNGMGKIADGILANKLTNFMKITDQLPEELQEYRENFDV